MTYSKYRAKFKTVEEFKKAFGRLSEEEARALIDAERCEIHIKACMMSTWQSARAEYEKQSVSAYDHYQMSCLKEVEACENQDCDDKQEFATL